MSEKDKMSGLKLFLIQAGAGFLASAAAAWLVVPSHSVDFAAITLGVVAIPIALGLAAIGCSFYGIFVLIKIVDVIATKIGIFDDVL